MITASNVFKLMRSTRFSKENNTSTRSTYLKQRRTILEQLKEESSQKIFNNHRFFRRSKNDITIEGKPEGLVEDGIIMTRQSKNKDLTVVPFHNYVKAQVMMFTAKRSTCLYTSYFQGEMCTQILKQNKTMVKYIFDELARALNKRPRKRSYKTLLTKVLPLAEGDKLTYFLEHASVEKEKTFTQQWQVNRYLKAKNNIFNIFKENNYTSIPESFSFEPSLETLSQDALGDDIIYRPHFSTDKYFIQPFALVKTSVIATALNTEINNDGYTLVFPTYSLPPDYKMKSAKYAIQAAFVEEYLKARSVQTCGFYTLIDHQGGFKMVEVEKCEDINLQDTPCTDHSLTDLNKKDIIKHGLYPFLNKDKGYKRVHHDVAEKIQDVCLLMNVGPRKRKVLHSKQIYTLSDLYRASQRDEVQLPILSQRFLEVNNQNKVAILPVTLEKNLPKHDDECFVDMEFAYDKSLDYTCIYNIGILRVKNDTEKFDQLTIEKLNQDGEFELLDKFFKLIQGRTRLYHWNHTERTMLRSAIERHDFPKDWELPECIDFFKVMKDNAIAVKGCYNLKLKSVAKAMKEGGLIDHYHDDIVPGTDLSTKIIHMYETDSYNIRDPFLTRVEEYNKDDIYTMYEIIEAVRKYYE